MTKVKLRVDASGLASLDLSGISAHLAPKVKRAFDDKIGPHAVKAAKARCPVSEDRDSVPQLRSFKAVRLLPLGTFPRGAQATRLSELHGLSSRERAQQIKPSDIGFFRGVGKNKGQEPDEIDIIRGTVKGAFLHKPGTLRDSIVWEPARVEGNRVIGRLKATAPYAAAIHEGFTHRGGPKHTGRSTRIKGNKFLTQAIVNIRGPLASKSTYDG